MSGSVVFYRFKSQREPSTVSFEGTGISVWDLKREILAANNLGRGHEFNFSILNADTLDEYTDDRAIVPRNTSVVARRLPPLVAGRGNAQMYMVSTSAAPNASSSTSNRGANSSGRGGHMSKRFDGREDSHNKAATPVPQQQSIVPGASVDSDEASRIAAMFASTNEQWKNTQEKMSSATPLYFGKRPGVPGARPTNNSTAPDKPVPPGYVCFRCGEKGHWIQDCPTNDKPEWDNKPRIKRTTGIPKSFLQAVEGPSKDGEGQAGVMVTAEGSFVIARPDAASWEKHRAVVANLTSNDVQNMAPTDPDLTCPLCNRLLRDAVKTPCCSTSYCEECIQNYLSENDFVCPECESKIKSLKNLVKDEDRRSRAKQYLEDTVKASKEAAEKEKAAANADKDGDTKSEGSAGGKTPVAAQEEPGPAEEGELDPDDAVRNPNNANGSVRAQASASGVPGNSNEDQTQQQMQMLQAQIQSTVNILQSPSLPMAMRMQLQAQLQGLQYQYGQMMQMTQTGAVFNMQQRMMLMQQMQTMQNMQRMMMVQNGMQAQAQMMQAQQQQFQRQFGNPNGNGYMNQNQNQYPNQMYHQNNNFNRNNNHRPSGRVPNAGRNAAHYAENSADSPYQRLPVNPAFRNGGMKRERPEDFVEVNQPNKR